MADVKLVIKIPEEIYDECNGDVYFPDTGAIVWDAVSKGTPLPKGHGFMLMPVGRSGSFDKVIIKNDKGEE